MPSKLKNVLEICIKVINTVKSSALNSCFLKFFVQSYSLNILFYYFKQVRWLSKGNMLVRLYELKSDVKMKPTIRKSRFLWKFYWRKFHILLCISRRLFETINSLNLKLQGRNTNEITVNDSINSFLENILLWKWRMNKETPIISSFRRLNKLLSDEEKLFVLLYWKIWWLNILIVWLKNWCKFSGSLERKMAIYVNKLCIRY